MWKFVSRPAQDELAELASPSRTAPDAVARHCCSATALRCSMIGRAVMANGMAAMAKNKASTASRVLRSAIDWRVCEATTIEQTAPIPRAKAATAYLPTSSPGEPKPALGAIAPTERLRVGRPFGKGHLDLVVELDHWPTPSGMMSPEPLPPHAVHHFTRARCDA